jgi:hypothetical protein
MVTPELVSKVLSTIKTAADSQYFFDNLHSHEWVRPLHSAGLFDNPPGPIEHGDSISFPVWPPSRYLARVADLAPEIVLEAIKVIPDTGNPRVYEDLADALLKMPAELAVELVPQALKWCQIPHQLLLPYKLAALANNLASGDLHEAALRLLKELLIILPDPRAEEMAIEDRKIFVPQPRPRIDEWTFKEIVSKQLPSVLADTGMDGLRLVSDLLDCYVRFSRPEPSQLGSEDYSFIWRPAIEDHAQNHRDDLDDALVVAVRDGSQQLVRANPSRAHDVIEQLESRPWDVFQRIALHVMRMNPDLLMDEIVQRLADKHLADSSALFHEFWLLAGEQFGNLIPEARSVLLSNIEAGPRDSYLTKVDDPEYSTKIWKWRRLALLGGDLPEPWKTEYAQLQEEFGQLGHREFLTFTSGVTSGPNSPLSRDELAGMQPKDIADWLRKWEPSEDFMAPSAEGLSRELTSVVAENPQPFAASANKFTDLQPTYVRSLIDGFKQACSNDAAFEWSNVLVLCQWAISQGRGASSDGPDFFEQDRNWLPARRSIAWLLAKGFSSKSCEIPLALRQAAWSVLEPLTEDPEPSRENELQEGGFFGDPATSSINTIRGLALHATIRYALWVKRHADETKSKNMGEIPEVLRVLEDSLRVDSTATVRAVFGQWFPWLVLIDAEWAKASKLLIFPPAADLAYLRDAAWDTYLKMSPAYNNVFDILRDQYREAIDRILLPPPSGLPWRHPSICLAEHLMAFYWKEKIEFGDPDGLLERFFDRASDELTADAIGFVGRSVEHYKDPVPQRTLERLMALWQNRIDAIRASGEPGNHRQELAAFGWWFLSSQWDEQWALGQLLDVLSWIREIEAHTHVVHRLAEMSSGQPSKATLALRFMIEGDEHSWNIGLWSDDARVILSNAIHSGDEAAWHAVDLIHYLAARNNPQFRDLLPSSGII